MTPFGQHMRTLRREKNVSQKEMAKAIGVSAAYLSALEHGKRGKPSWSLLQRIAGYFNVIWDDAELLQSKADLSDPRVIIDTSDLSATATEAANVLRDKIAHMNDKQLEELRDHLSRIRRNR